MSILRSSTISTASAVARRTAASVIAADNTSLSMTGATPMAETTDQVSKTPDYHLPWTGEVVEETLRKMMNFDPATDTGVIILASTSEEPANIDTATEVGNYTANYMTSTLSTWPTELTGVSPINMVVYEKDGVIYQMIEGLGDRYTRYSKDDGASWSVFSPKTVNSGGIDDSGESGTPKPDPIEEIQNELDDIKQRLDTELSGAVSFGTAENAQAMLDGKYDWDTGTIVT